MPEAQEETTYVKNIFGLVTDKRVVYHRDRGWLKEGLEQEVPLDHVKSVSLATSRHLMGGIVLVLVGLLTLIVLVGVIFIMFGAVLIWGSPTVIVNKADGDRDVMKGWPWHRGPAYDFAMALQGRIGSDQEVRLEHVGSVSVGTSRHLLSGPLLFVIVIAALIIVICAIVWLVMLFGLSPF